MRQDLHKIKILYITYIDFEISVTVIGLELKLIIYHIR